LILMRFQEVQIVGGDSARKYESVSQNIAKEKVEKTEKRLAFLNCYKYNGLQYYQKKQHLSDRNLR